MSVVDGDLVREVVYGDSQAKERAVRLLQAEWRPRIRRMLQNPGDEEIDDLFQSALVALCLPSTSGASPRALAGPDVRDPRAWRLKVLKNFVRDRLRHQGRRAHAEVYAGVDIHKAVEAKSWRERKAGNTIHAPKPPPSASSTEGEEALLAHNLKAGRRDKLRDLAPSLVISRRVILLLCAGMDPSPFAEELAQKLQEPPNNTQSRIQRALADKEPEELLSMPRVRVPWPQGDAVMAKENARKALERALNDIRPLLSKIPE